MDHLRRSINTQTLVLLERDRGRKFLTVVLVLNGDIVLTGSLADGIIHIHPAGAGHAIDTKNRVAGLDARLGGYRAFFDLTDHIAIDRHRYAGDRVDAHKQQKARQDIDENAREQHKGTLEKTLAQIGMRTLLLKKLRSSDRQLPHIALGSSMLSIELASVKGGISCSIARQRLVPNRIIAG